MSADGGNPVQLTNNAVFDGLPDWSPDGSRITYYGATAGKTDACCPGRRRRTNAADLDSRVRSLPALLTRRHQIVFMGAGHLYVMGADGSAPMQLRWARGACRAGSP